MRVAYICADPGVPVFGRKGCSIHVQEVIRALQGQDLQVDLFACRFGGDPPCDLGMVDSHLLPHSSNSNQAAREQHALSLNSYLHSALKDAGPFDLIYERYSLWSFAAMEYARAAGIPGVLEVNAPLIEEQAKYRHLVNRVAAEQVAERVFGAATTLIAVSDDIAEYLKRYMNTRKGVHVVPNGVNPGRFPEDVKPSCLADQGQFTVGFVGSLKRWHGLTHLVEAFSIFYRLVRNSRLLIVGDGPERESLIENLSARRLSKAAYFSGAVDPNEVPGLLASMDVAVAPYPAQQHFYFSPLKVYEYMAAGLPVVASRVGQLKRLIQDGKNGFLCSPGDPHSLAATLYRLSRDPELLGRLGRAARETVHRNYSWETIVGRILRLAGIKPFMPALV
jgi:glycosyltransferase involved in cell wall biosynthesis